jgi:hypothetical protein
MEHSCWMATVDITQRFAEHTIKVERVLEKAPITEDMYFESALAVVEGSGTG